MAINQYPLASVSNRSTVAVTPVNNTFTIDCSAGTDFYLDLSQGTYSSTELGVPKYVGGATLGFGGSTSVQQTISLTGLTGGIGTAPAEGDIVIVAYGIGSTTDKNVALVTSGYTEVADIYSNGTFDANLGVYYKIMGSTPDTSVTLAATGSASDGGAVTVQVWRGVDQTTPLDVTTVTLETSGTVNPNPPAITTITNNTQILAIGAKGGSSTHIFSSTELSNFIYENHSDTNSITVGMGSYFLPTAGTFDPAAINSNGSTERIAVATMALRPGPGYGIASVNFTNNPNTYKQVYVHLDAKTKSGLNLGYKFSFSGVFNYSASSYIDFNQYYQESFIVYGNEILRFDQRVPKIEHIDYINSTQVWRAPQDVSAVEVILCGGGAGSEGNSGGGGSVYRSILSVNPGAFYTITIGAGGAPTGSSSTFGNLLTANGGGSSGNLFVGAGLGGHGGDYVATAPGAVTRWQTNGYRGYGDGGGAGLTLNNLPGAPANSGRGANSEDGTNGGSGVAIIKYWSAL